MPSPLKSVPGPLRRTVLWLAVALVVGYVVVPQLASAGRSAGLLGEVDAPLVALGVALQAAAIVAQAQLTRSMLPDDRRPSLGDMARIELAATAAAHTVPGGTAAGTALGYRLLRDADVPSDDAAFAVAARGIGAAVVLNGLLWLALIVSIPTQGFHPLYAAAAGLAVALLAVFGVVVVLVARHHEAVVRRVQRAAARLPLVDEDTVADAVRNLAERAREVGSRPRLFAIAAGWSAAYWLASAAALWVFLAAFGHHAAPTSLLVAFGVANVVAFLPVTPRGLGVTEATLIPLLAWFGADRGVATLAVLGWRLVAFWLPIPVGAVAYLTLQAAPAGVEHEDAPGPGWGDRLRDLMDDLVDSDGSDRARSHSVSDRTGRSAGRGRPPSPGPRRGTGVDPRREPTRRHRRARGG